VDDILNAIGNYGFPIAITGYLLLRMESKLDKLTDAINALCNRIPKKEAET
jgi:hypothetical protein